MYRLIRFAIYNPVNMQTINSDINTISRVFHDISVMENTDNLKMNLSYEMNRINPSISVNRYRAAMEISLAKRNEWWYMEIVGEWFYLIYKREDS